MAIFTKKFKIVTFAIISVLIVALTAAVIVLAIYNKKLNSVINIVYEPVVTPPDPGPVGPGTGDVYEGSSTWVSSDVMEYGYDDGLRSNGIVRIAYTFDVCPSSYDGCWTLVIPSYYQNDPGQCVHWFNFESSSQINGYVSTVAIPSTVLGSSAQFSIQSLSGFDSITTLILAGSTIASLSPDFELPSNIENILVAPWNFSLAETRFPGLNIGELVDDYYIVSSEGSFGGICSKVVPTNDYGSFWFTTSFLTAEARYDGADEGNDTSQEVLVIPEAFYAETEIEINGSLSETSESNTYIVTGVAGGAIKCNERTIYIPPTVAVIENGAFNNDYGEYNGVFYMGSCSVDLAGAFTNLNGGPLYMVYCPQFPNVYTVIEEFMAAYALELDINEFEYSALYNDPAAFRSLLDTLSSRFSGAFDDVDKFWNWWNEWGTGVYRYV